jgi:hypothetical protein
MIMASRYIILKQKWLEAAANEAARLDKKPILFWVKNTGNYL